MAVLFPNALISTARGATNPTTYATSAPTANLLSVSAHLAPVRAVQLAVLPADAAQVTYVATVESGTDVQIGDLITSITLPDGITPWPFGPSAQGSWWVRYTQETAPGLLPSRQCYLAYVLTGGPAQ